jgi:hypothetical protein
MTDLNDVSGVVSICVHTGNRTVNGSVVIVSFSCFHPSGLGQQFLTRSCRCRTHPHRVDLQFYDYPTKKKPPFPVEEGEASGRVSTRKGSVFCFERSSEQDAGHGSHHQISNPSQITSSVAL